MAEFDAVLATALDAPGEDDGDPLDGSDAELADVTMFPPATAAAPADAGCTAAPPPPPPPPPLTPPSPPGGATGAAAATPAPAAPEEGVTGAAEPEEAGPAEKAGSTLAPPARGSRYKLNECSCRSDSVGIAKKMRRNAGMIVNG